MKNPNGYGTVTKLSGNRRKPYIIKEGISGKQKPIGYAATREEGLIMLAQYNHAPWNVEAEKMTLQELYNLWLEKRAVKLGKSNRNAMTYAYKYCAGLSRVRYKQINSFQMQDCIDRCGHGYSTQGAIKNLWVHLDRFAMELDIITKCCSSLLAVDPTPESKKEIFSEKEIEKLWKHQKGNWVDSVLFFLYTGFRISEMIDLKTENVDLTAGTIRGGTKTASGKNRIVPIHSKIRPIVERRIALSESGYLFEYNGKKLNQTQYRIFWASVMEKLNTSHTPHECRHTFRSRLDTAGANKVCIDRLMGHKSAGTGERVYTHKTIEELRKNIELLA